ncbi:MAG: hypothetical protein RR215_06850, partial [Ruthenibacterium sp.]
VEKFMFLLKTMGMCIIMRTKQSQKHGKPKPFMLSRFVPVQKLCTFSLQQVVASGGKHLLFYRIRCCTCLLFYHQKASKLFAKPIHTFRAL